MAEKLITINEAAKRIGVSKSKLYELAGAGLLPHYRIPGKKRDMLRVYLPEVAEFLRGYRVGPPVG